MNRGCDVEDLLGACRYRVCRVALVPVLCQEAVRHLLAMHRQELEAVLSVLDRRVSSKGLAQAS